MIFIIFLFIFSILLIVSLFCYLLEPFFYFIKTTIVKILLQPYQKPLKIIFKNHLEANFRQFTIKKLFYFIFIKIFIFYQQRSILFISVNFSIKLGY